MKLKDLVTPEYVAIEAAASGERALAVSKLHWWQGTQLTRKQLEKALMAGKLGTDGSFCGLCERYWSSPAPDPCGGCPLNDFTGGGCGSGLHRKADDALVSFIAHPTTVKFRAWRVASRAMYKVIDNLEPGE